ncbi:MAG: PDZ domain-containing protein [bacterium]|nr:PDZ domain-containing protein [bacterium]
MRLVSRLALPLLAGALLLAGAAAVQAHGSDEDHGDSKAYLGVQLTEEIDHPEGGALIEWVAEGSPADEAGLQKGDIVQRFDGKVVRGPEALGRRLGQSRSGDRVSVTIVRDGREKTLQVELGESPWRHHGSFTWSGEFDSGQLEEWAEEFGERMAELGERFGEKFGDPDRWQQFERFSDPEFLEQFEHHGRSGQGPFVFRMGGRPLLGVQLVDATSELREHLGSDETAGVLVSKVLDDMPAERAGVEVGDLIVTLDGEPIGDSRDLRRALQVRSGETFDLVVLRDGREVALEVTLPEQEEAVRRTGPRA